MSQNPISRESAIELCNEIVRHHHNSRLRFFKLNYWQCWGCQRFGNKDGSFSNICALNAEGNRGCYQVNKIYDK